MWSASEVTLTEMQSSRSKQLRLTELLPAKSSKTLDSLKESQELPPKAVKIILAAEENELQGQELIESLQVVAALAASENIEVKRRLGSLYKNEAEKNTDTINSIVKPKVLALMKQVHNKKVFRSEEMENALKMEPSELAEISNNDLERLERDVGWLIEKLWSKQPPFCGK